MGFPRILSKNNRIYTKLGEFCLSGDSNHFWIVCHTCQAELQTQDHFWKHIQDEHNFSQSGILKHEQTRSNSSSSYIDTEGATALMPLPLYRKVESEQRILTENTDDDDENQDQDEPKDYTEMRVIEPTVDIEIKEEPTQLRHVQTTPQINAAAIYQLPQVPTQLNVTGTTYTTMVHTGSSLNITPPASQQSNTSAMIKQDLPNETNNIVLNASSEDSERWYICDYEACGLKFKYQSRLELHRAVHSKERRYACEVCGCAFKQSCNLSTHRKKKHFLKGIKGGIIQQQHPQQIQQQQLQMHQQQIQQQRF